MKRVLFLCVLTISTLAYGDIQKAQDGLNKGDIPAGQDALQNLQSFMNQAPAPEVQLRSGTRVFVSYATTCSFWINEEAKSKMDWAVYSKKVAEVKKATELRDQTVKLFDAFNLQVAAFEDRETLGEITRHIQGWLSAASLLTEKPNIINDANLDSIVASVRSRCASDPKKSIDQVLADITIELTNLSDAK